MSHQPELQQTTAMISQKALERNALACILNSAESLNEIDLPSAAFESPDLRAAYSMIRDLRDTGHDEVSISTLRHFYDARADFQAAVQDHGGWKFLETLAYKPDLHNFRLHISELKLRQDVRSLKGKVVNALDSIRDRAFANPEEVLAVLDEQLGTTEARRAGSIIESGSLGGTWLQRQSERFVRGDFKGNGIAIPEPLSHACGRRWDAGSLNIWAGETNVGKSMIIQMLVGDFCIDRGIPTLVLDNEMSQEQFENRMMARASGIETKNFKDGCAYEPDSPFYNQLSMLMPRTEIAPFTWVQQHEMKIYRIEALVRRFLRKYPKELYPAKQVIVDGIKLEGGNDSFWSAGFFAQELKLMIQRYATDGLVGHATCQLNKGGAQKGRSSGKENEHPTHLDVGLSKLIPDNADDFYILLHHYNYDADETKLFDKQHRRLVCTKAREHATLEGRDFLLMEFKGEKALLRPESIVLDGKGMNTPGAGNLPGTLDPFSGL